MKKLLTLSIILFSFSFIFGKDEDKELVPGDNPVNGNLTFTRTAPARSTSSATLAYLAAEAIYSQAQRKVSSLSLESGLELEEQITRLEQVETMLARAGSHLGHNEQNVLSRINRLKRGVTRRIARTRRV
ncbi:MAG TPA: hypothetical protein QGF02_00735 [Candidatus Babeliales bacterium]|nr:hypothetical protein [Candidatus Babeliales bacterium]